MATTTTVATIERYSGDREDWTVWHARFRGALDDVDLLEVADGTEVEPSAGGDAVVDTVTRKTDTKQGHWKRKNRKLFSALQRALDDDQMVTVTSAVADGDGKAAYDELVRLNKATTTASLNAILIQLLLLRADDEDGVDRVLAKQQSLNTQLKTGKAGRELSDETMAALVFLALPSSMDGFADRYMDSDEPGDAGNPMKRKTLITKLTQHITAIQQRQAWLRPHPSRRCASGHHRRW